MANNFHLVLQMFCVDAMDHHNACVMKDLKYQMH